MQREAAMMTGIEVLTVRYLEPGERAKLRVRACRQPGVYIEGAAATVSATSADPTVLRVEGDELVGAAVGRATVTVVAAAEDGTTCEERLEIEVVAGAARSGRETAPHPRVLFTEEERLRLKARVAAPETAPPGVDVARIWRELREEGEAYLRETGFRVTYLNAPDVIDVSYPLRQPAPLPNPAGYVDYPFWTMYSRRIEERLVTLSTLYGVTEDDRYAAKVRSMLLDLAAYERWYEFPRRGAEGNLSNAHFTIGVASAYDAVYGTLSEEERSVVRTAILEKGLRPMAIDFGNDDQHNIIVAKQVAMMIAALAIVDEEPAAGKYIERTYDYIRTYLDQRVDSDETEGLMYNNIAAKHLAQAAVALKKACGDASLIEHRFLTEVVPEQFFYFQAAGGEATFATLSDCHPKLDLSYIMSLLAENASNAAAMWYVTTYEPAKQPLLLNLSRGTTPAAPDDYFRGRESKAFPRIGWAAFRSGWGAKDHMLGFTSSPSAKGHNHLDQNHFVMNVAGEWLIRDPGYQDYRPGPKNEFTDGSVGHNVLLINGRGQSRRGGGRLDAWLTSPSFDYGRGDATDSYEGSLRRWKRSVLHVDKSYYLVIDDIALNDPSDRAELLLHGTPDIEQGGEKLAVGAMLDAAAPYAFRGERAAVRVAGWTSAPADAAVTAYAGAEEYGPYVTYRLSADAAGEAIAVALLEPCPDGVDAAPERELRVEARDGGLLVAVDGADRIVVAGPGRRVGAAGGGGGDPAETIRLDGALGRVRGAANGAWPAAVALADGTRLALGERTLLAASSPANAAATYEAAAAELAASLPQAATIDVALPFAPASCVLLGTGEALPFAFRPEDGVATIELPAGEHRATWRAAE
ncbi:heparinase [Paenibacillus antri]|uniref:Heparinase n=1 Tax=Paenibacillus antri TaxID=2582848 RepID=A0A5R9GFB5_9BACL|nr:heparinase II/III family protein [Paenibacillus antri]TLS52058.1 heparinase [Paenibacillus antri]